MLTKHFYTHHEAVGRNSGCFFKKKYKVILEMVDTIVARKQKVLYDKSEGKSYVNIFC